MCKQNFLGTFYIVTNSFTNSQTTRLPHPRSGDSQGQETFLAKTRNYDKECSN